MKRFIVPVFCALLMLMAMPAFADYESCRTRECGQGKTCKECQNGVNRCCRNEYDTTKDLSAYIACTTANALGYAQCTGSVTGAFGDDLGDLSEEQLFKGLADSTAAQIATDVALELLKLAADLEKVD